MDVLEKITDPQDQRNYLLKITQNASYKRLKKHQQEDCVDQLPETRTAVPMRNFWTSSACTGSTRPCWKG